MIRYRLVCNKKHEFESWFGSSTAYDRLAKKGQVECPQCGSKKVTKAMMSPGVATRNRSKESREVAVPADHQTTAVPAPAPSPEMVLRAEMQQQFLDLMRKVRAEVEDKAEYVGPKFADEARKIHHEEAEARGIWGEATLDEARELAEDGIACLPLPRLPEDSN
jgi:hypothetical protein